MYSLEELMRLAAEVECEVNGKWVPARPVIECFKRRLVDAWKVLLGKADAFYWPEGQ